MWQSWVIDNMDPSDTMFGIPPSTPIPSTTNSHISATSDDVLEIVPVAKTPWLPPANPIGRPPVLSNPPEPAILPTRRALDMSQTTQKIPQWSKFGLLMVMSGVIMHEEPPSLPEPQPASTDTPIEPPTDPATSEVLTTADPPAPTPILTRPTLPNTPVLRQPGPRPIRPNFIMHQHDTPMRPRIDPRSIFRGTGFHFPPLGPTINVPPNPTITTHEPRRPRSEPDFNRYQSFIQPPGRFTSHNDRTPAPTHNESLVERPVPLARTFTNQGSLPDDTDNYDASPKRRRYYDPSKVKVSDFTGFGCLDVAKWIRNYSDMCLAQQVNRSRGLILHCHEPTYYRMMEHPMWPQLNDMDPSEDPWHTVKQVMEEMFFMPKDDISLMQDYLRCTMRLDESPQVFYARLDEAALAAKQPDDSIRACFWRGLTKKLKDRMGTFNPSSMTLQAIVTRAVQAHLSLAEDDRVEPNRKAPGCNTMSAPSATSSKDAQPTSEDDNDSQSAKLLAMNHDKSQSPKKNYNNSSKPKFQKGKPHHKSSQRSDSSKPTEPLPSTPGVVCSICGFMGHTAAQCKRGQVVAARLEEAKKKGFTILVLREYEHSLMHSFLIINNQANRPVMWDSGASFNFMHSLEANLLGIATTPSPIAYVVVGNEDLLQVEGQVTCVAAFESDPSTEMIFHVVSKLPYRMIIGLSGMKSLQVMLDVPEMAIISKVSQTTVRCILDPLTTVDDSLFTFIPVDVSTDHDDEMEVEAASLDEVKQWGDTSDTPMAWTMPQIGQDTSQYFQSAMSDLCNEFRSIFTEFSILDDVSGKEHFEIIVKPGAIPQYVTLGRIPHYQREIIEEFITLFLKLGIIEPANSPWGARPIIIKKGTSHRLCVNYAPLNEVTQRDNWPVPLVEDIIDKLINSKLFYTCDLRRAFMQFPIKEEHRFYTAFVSHLGTFQFKRVPFGVMNGPAFLARQVDRMLRSATDVQKFFDDIVAGTPHGEEELLISIRRLFNLLFDARLRLNPEKSFFGVREVKVLGCIVSEKGRRIDPAKLEGVLSIKSCTNATAVRQFTGICNYFSTYIKDYADISEPLVRLMRKDVDFVWTKLCEDSFQLLKILLTQAPVLAIPDPKRPFHVHTDASAYALGAVLLQEDLTLPGQLKPIWYASRILLSAEKNYTTTEQEGLAVVWARKKFRYYLEGNQWTCATDHMALINILGTKSTSCRIQRWTLCLSGENLKVYHVKGESNVIADALSRLPLQLPSSIPIPIAQLITDNSGQEPISIGELRARAAAKKRLAMSSNPALFVMSTPHFSDPAVWKQAQSVDNWCAFIIEQLKFNPVSKFSMKHGYLLHSHDNVVFCLTVPNAFVKSVIHFNHTAPLAGHLATRKTIARISAQFFWPKLSSDVTNFIDNCILCVMEKGNRFIKSPLLDGSITVQANHVNDIVAWDIQGPFHLTSNNNKYILVISDLFSERWSVEHKQTERFLFLVGESPTVPSMWGRYPQE